MVEMAVVFSLKLFGIDNGYKVILLYFWKMAKTAMRIMKKPVSQAVGTVMKRPAKRGRPFKDVLIRGYYKNAFLPMIFYCCVHPAL